MSQTNSVNERTRRVTSSMLWAAWADALGFISELTDAAGLRRRLGGANELTEPVAWKRRVGGKFGVSATLPAGCYSDDTQLRLATARALSPRGFDVEAFTAVELSLWPSYALGGGRASKSAAAGFTKPDTPWFANFFDGWVNAGGNGAAMRIQPHVWAATTPGGLGDHLHDVLINAISTHGHPRALVGAVLHAVALGEVLFTGQMPDPRGWRSLVDTTDRAFDLLYDNDMVATVWIPAWEKTTGASLREAWRETTAETHKLLTVASDHVPELTEDQATHGDAYLTLCNRLGLCDDATRGSGTATVVAALALAAAHRADPRQCSLIASRALGTDTDTIATMAAAMVGATAVHEELPTPVQDSEYLIAEARRLAALAEGGAPVESISYPDLLAWQPPRSQLDAVGLVDGQLALAGLGMLTPQPDSEPVTSRGARWRWFRSDFGATFLLKYREDDQLRELPSGNRPPRRVHNRAFDRHADPHDAHSRQRPLLDTVSVQNSLPQSERERAETKPIAFGRDAAAERRSHTNIVVDQMLAWVARNEFSDNSIGYAVRRITDLGTVEQLIAFTTALRRATHQTFPDHRDRRDR
jgi:ADP-ribosylglycohydrolase